MKDKRGNMSKQKGFWLDGPSTEIPVYPKQCIFCIHYRKSFRRKKDYMLVHTCDAFPKGIPHDIIFGKFDHTMPHEGDNGIRFERIETK